MRPTHLSLSWHSHQHKYINKFTFYVKIAQELRIDHLSVKISCIRLLTIEFESSSNNFLVVLHAALGHLEVFTTFSWVIPYLISRRTSNFSYLKKILKRSFVTI